MEKQSNRGRPKMTENLYFEGGQKAEKARVKQRIKEVEEKLEQLKTNLLNDASEMITNYMNKCHELMMEIENDGEN